MFIQKLYKNNLELMCRKANEIMGDFYLAEDIVHEVFVKIIYTDCIKKLIGMEPEACKYYLLAMVRNKALNTVRKYARETYAEEIEETAKTTVEEIMLKKLSAQELKEELKQLPKIYQDILIGKYLYDQSDEQLAQKYQINVALVRKRLERARKKLKDMYLEEHKKEFGKCN